MADITKTYTIPSALVPELIEVFGQNYQSTIDDGQGGTTQNPQTKAQFDSATFDSEIKSYVRRRVVEYRRLLAKTQVSQQFEIV